jgi:hypothetical protein
MYMDKDSWSIRDAYDAENMERHNAQESLVEAFMLYFDHEPIEQ